jgi:cytochrome c biogenesis protein CcdA
MTSLGEAYDSRGGEASRRRVYLGTGLFAAGALLVAGGILAVATGVLVDNGFGIYEVREIAGILAGLGIPAVFVGIFTVLPANRLQRAAAAVGSGLTVLGVMLFRSAYPMQWYAPNSGLPSTQTLAFLLVYAAGIITTFWCLFTAVATFKTRNDPGGTVTLTVTKNGETRTVEVPASDVESAREALTSGSFGGVGVFGGVEDPEQETRANASEPAIDSDSEPAQHARSSKPDSSAGPAASVSDGGAASQDISSPLDDTDDGPGPDEYCGNCVHFDYRDTDDGMQPYCGLYEETMDDMEACEWWEANNQQ